MDIYLKQILFAVTCVIFSISSEEKAAFDSQKESMKLICLAV